ncbi:MAG: hypothetical protein KAJ18_11735 [Candidatus Omnitrophica bacterium]|nr:hypothetical protein [Candidatus Omnitrophota bacterium]
MKKNIKNHDKIFLATLCLLVILCGSIVIENVRTIVAPKEPNIQIDAAKARETIEKTNLPLHEAMYWEVIK